MGPSLDDSGVVPLGSVLDGRYRVDSVLGKGGMGRVYKAEHTSLGRPVAIKVLHSDLGRNKEATQRFQREALASGRLDHPNIVGVSDFGVLPDGSLYLVMEALEGEGLGARLTRDKRLSWAEAADIVRQMLFGLRHAHDKGVVHRDIKPDNIFLANKDGERVIKILDFGIAKLYAGSGDDPAMTRAGLTVGTPAYLSPEQAVGGEIKPASDLYSLSVVFYEMLTGRPPYEDKDPLAIMTAHVSRDVPVFSEVAPDLVVPAGLEAVIRHGLEKMQDDRFGSANEYLAALDRVLHDAGMAVASRGSAVMTVPSVAMTPAQGSTIVPASHASASTPPPFARPRASTAPAGMPTAVAKSMQMETQPIAKKWLWIVGSVFGVAFIIAIALKVSGGPAHKRGAAGSASGGSDVAVADVDHAAQLEAALHELEAGSTCAARKAAIPKLVELGDASAIPALKRARYRMEGGSLTSNACLKADADAAIKQLGAIK